MTIFSRRALIGQIGAVVGAAALTPRSATAQGAQAVPPPPPFDTHRDYRPTAEPVSYPDPDIITVDPAFNALRVNNTAIHRLWTGGMHTLVSPRSAANSKAYRTIRRTPR